jgi:hypothetical protein
MTKHCTSSQAKFLRDNMSHLEMVSMLEDGDMLIVDNGKPMDSTWNNGHYGPYILTREGHLQDVNYHYSKYHSVNCPYLLV